MLFDLYSVSLAILPLHTYTYHGSIQIEHRAYSLYAENAIEELPKTHYKEYSKTKSNKIKQSREKEGEKRRLKASEPVSLLASHGADCSSFISIRIGSILRWFRSLDLLGLYANVNDSVSILMLVYVSEYALLACGFIPLHF